MNVRKTLKLLGKAGIGFSSAAGIFALGILGCVAYGMKNGTIDKLLNKREEEENKNDEELIR